MMIRSWVIVITKSIGRQEKTSPPLMPCEGLWDHTTETTKEFWDFAEQEYGIQAIIDRMKEKYPGFPYHGDRSQALLEKEIRMYFDRRDLQMEASQFTDTEIPQV